MKKISKILISFTMITILMMNFVYANTTGNTGEKGQSVTQEYGINPTPPGGSINTIGQGILGAIQAVGYLVAFGILLIYGIKWLLATANEKADLKKGFVNYVIGAILVAGATTIAGWVFGLV